MFKSEIFKSITLLSSGTVLAQVIPLLFAPLIARLYDARDFGEYAAILGVLNIVSVVVNGRYELAVVLPKLKIQAFKVVVGSWLIGFVVSVVVLIVLLVFQSSIAVFLNIDFGLLDAFLIYIGLLFISFWQPMNYFFIRNKNYRKMTYNKFVKSISTLTVTLLLGFFLTDNLLNGLVIGLLAGWMALACYTHWQGSRVVFRKFHQYIKGGRNILKQYSEYPKFNALPALLNSIGSQLGLYVFVYLFSTEYAGHYSFAKQYLYAPLSILGLSLSQVYFQRMSVKYKTNQSIYKELSILFGVLVGISLVMISIITMFASEIFQFVFGNEWIISAEMSKILIFAFCFQFIVSPLSMVLHALRRVKLASIFPIVYIISISLLFLLENQSIEVFVRKYILAEILPYTIYLGLIVYAIFSYEKKIINMQNVKAELE